MREKIIRNSAKCLRCGDEIESKSVHDFSWCSCENIAVDGGKDYLRRVGGTHGFEDTSITEMVDDPPPTKTYPKAISTAELERLIAAWQALPEQQKNRYTSRNAAQL